MLPGGSGVFDSSVCGAVGDALGRCPRDCSVRALIVIIISSTRTMEIGTTDFMSDCPTRVRKSSPAITIGVAERMARDYARRHFGAVAGTSTPDSQHRTPRQPSGFR